MPSIDTLLPFIGISLLLALAPGPDNIFVLVQSSRYGVRAGLATMLGLCTGLMAHTASVAAGLGVVLSASLMAFTILKTIVPRILASSPGRHFGHRLALPMHRSRSPVSRGNRMPRVSP